MLSSVRLTNMADLRACGLWQEYEAAFPREERRSAVQQARAMAAESDFHCLCLRDAEGVAGLLFYWQMPHGFFVEHLAICAARRGLGLGHHALRLLQQQGLPVVLEIEPPNTEPRRRRLRFYESAGFTVLPYPHVQPAYHADTQPVPLVLLSCPGDISADDVLRFEAFQRDVVMRYAD